MAKKTEKLVKVLLAEDLASDAELEKRELKAALQDCAFKVVQTREDFLQALQDFQPDLIVSDYKMPVFDGLTALRLAREWNAQIPFVIATGSMNEDTAVECMKAGADDYVIKEHLRRLGVAAKNALKLAAERRQRTALEAEARAQQHFIERITNSVPMAIYIYDVEKDRNIYSNRGIAELIGYTLEEVLAMGSKLMPAIMHPEDLAKLAGNIARFDNVADGQVLELDYRMRAKDGSYRWLHSWDVVFARDAKGKPTQLLGSVQDVTAQKEAEAALRASEDKFKYVFNNSVIGKSLTLPNGEMLANKAFYSMLGYNAEQVRGKTWQEFSHPDDIDSTQKIVDELLSGKKKTARFEKRYIKQDGSVVWADVSTTIRLGEDGKPQYFLTSIADITETVQARLALQRSEKEFRTIFEVASVGIVQADTHDGSFIGCNDTYCRITGYNREELLKMNFRQITHPEDREQDWKLYNAAARREIPQYINEKRYIRKDGSVIWVRLNSAFIRDENDKALRTVSVCEDITERKLASQKLEESEKRFRSFFEVASLGITHLDPVSGKFLRANQAYCNMTGYSEQELSTMSLKDVTPAEDSKKEWQFYREKIEQGAPAFQLEKRILKKDGGLIWAHINAAIIHDSDGKPQSSIGIVEDITVQKQVEEIARRNEARLQSLVEIAQYQSGNNQELLDFALEKAITLTESRIGYIYFYSEPEKQFTLNTWSKEVLPACKVMNPQTIYELEKTGIWGEAVRQRKPIIVNDFTMPNPLKKGYPQGHVPLSSFMTIPIFDREEIVAVVGVGNKQSAYDAADERQLTLLMDAVWKMAQRQKAEEELRASESKLRGVIDALADAIILTDPQGTVIEWNPAAERLFRMKRAEVLGRALWDVQFELFANLADEPDSYERLKRFMLEMHNAGKGEFFTKIREQQARLRDGSLIYIESIAFAFDKTEAGWHIGSISRDVTQRKQAEEALRTSETKFRTLFNTMFTGACLDEAIYKDGMMIDYRILDVNPSYERILGVKRKDVIDNLASQIYAPHPVPYLDIYQQVVESGKPQEFEAFFPPANKYLHLSAFCPEKGRFSTTFTDITERQKAADELKAKVEELQRFHDVTVDRELRMVELKREVNALLRAAGQNEKYKGLA